MRGNLEAMVSVTGKRSTYRCGFCSFSKLLFHGSSNSSRGWRRVCLSSSLLLILKLSEGRTSPKVVLRRFVLLTNQRKWGMPIGLPRRKGIKTMCWFKVSSSFPLMYAYRGQARRKWKMVSLIQRPQWGQLGDGACLIWKRVSFKGTWPF